MNNFFLKSNKEILVNVRVHYVKDTYEILALFKLRIYLTRSYSHPDQTSSMELLVGYFCKKLRLGWLPGFLSLPTLYLYTYNLYS